MEPNEHVLLVTVLLSQLINLGDIVGKAPEIFTEVADRNSAQAARERAYKVENDFFLQFGTSDR